MMRMISPFLVNRRWAPWCVCLILLTGVAERAVAQVLPPIWRWSNPAPFGADVYGAAQQSGLFVEVGEEGQLFVSSDMTNWVPCQTGTQNALRAAAFLGGRFIATGEDGTVVFSDDLSTFYVESFNTPNWLEGVAASSNLVVAVGDNASIYWSSDGALWSQASVSFSQWLNGVAYGATNFVAVGESGFIATSRNGSSWTVAGSGTKSNLNAVAWIGANFLVTGDGGVALTSPNGTTWSPVATGATNSLYATTGFAASQIVAGNLELRWNGGSRWSNELSGSLASPAPSWSYYSSVLTTNADEQFLVTGYAGLNVVCSNASGDPAWFTPTGSVRSWLWQVARTADHYLAVGNTGTLLSSPDGISWTVELTPDPATNAVLLAVGGNTNGGTNLIMAVGTKGTMLWATNSYLWYQLTSPTTNDLYNVLYDGGDYLVCGGNGTILTSPTTATWTKRTTGTTQTLSGMTYFPGGWVAVGDKGTVLTSTDRTIWKLSKETTNWLWSVSYLNGVLVAVGQNGTILTSADASHWTQEISGTTNFLSAVDFMGGLWFAAGDNGTFLASVDTTNWTSFPTITYEDLFGLAHNSGQLVAVGAEGIIIRSLIFPPATPVAISSYSRASGDDLFLFTGAPDQQFYLDSTTNLVDWSQGPLLEFYDGEDALIYDIDTNTQPQTFYRTSAVLQ
jgi:hypothetical protein